MSKKVLSEKQSREQLVGWARKYGCEADLLKIFSRYDELLKGCKTPEERKAVATMGALEVHNFFGGEGGLTVGGNVIKDDPSLKDLPEIPQLKLKNGRITK